MYGCAPRQLGREAPFGEALANSATVRARPASPEATATAQLATASPRKIDTSADSQFDASRAMSDILILTAFGVRKPGSAQEAKAAAWVADRLREIGYEPQLETFQLPNGSRARTSS